MASGNGANRADLGAIAAATAHLPRADKGEAAVVADQSKAAATALLPRADKCKAALVADQSKAAAVAAFPDGNPSSSRAASPDADLGNPYSYMAAPLTREEKKLREFAQKFVDTFYNWFNTTPETIHALYEESCNLVWAVHDAELCYEIKTASGVKEFWSKPGEIKCHNHCFVVQKSDDATLIMVNGLCDGFSGKKPSNFAECFLLNESSRIVKDILFVFEKDKPIRTPWCVTRAKAPGKQLLSAVPKTAYPNPMLRRSIRILKKSTDLTGCKKVDEIRSESKCMQEAVTRKNRDKEPVDFASRQSISVAILYDPIMLGHTPEFYCNDDDVTMGHHEEELSPNERPERISCIIEKLIEENLFDRATHVPHEPAALKDILAVHESEYVHFIQRLPGSSEDEKYIGYYSDEMYCSEGTCAAVFSAAGANIEACKLVISEKFKKAFAIVRPPGHHVATDEAEGFCYANNIAIGASFLLRNYAVEKILIVDWDVHSGNGTQKIFYESNQVVFFNIYNMNLDYPKSYNQGPKCIGKGNGAGFNFNVPLRSGFGDSDILYVWNELLVPLVKQFAPQITLISCGFDAAKGDPLGQANLTAPCYGTMIHKLDKAGNGKLVLTLEGGYKLPVVANCASHCVRALAGDQTALLDEKKRRDPVKKATVKTVNNLKRYHSMFWDPFERDPKG